jgi:pyruvate dehydrogenase E1 component alpha subunit
MQYKGEKNVVLTFYGDGASSQGVVHESLNYAAVFKLPVVFVINNNQYAISTPLHEQAAIENLALRAAGYGMPGKTIDGNRVLDVYVAVKAAVDRARTGQGPSLIECKTLRMAGHGTHDPGTYIPKDMIETWKKKDPITSFRKDMREKHGMSEAEERAIQERIEREIEEAVEWARTQPLPTPEDLPTWL